MDYEEVVKEDVPLKDRDIEKMDLSEIKSIASGLPTYPKEWWVRCPYCNRSNELHMTKRRQVGETYLFECAACHEIFKQEKKDMAYEQLTMIKEEEAKEIIDTPLKDLDTDKIDEFHISQIKHCLSGAVFHGEVWVRCPYCENGNELQGKDRKKCRGYSLYECEKCHKIFKDA